MKKTAYPILVLAGLALVVVLAILFWPALQANLIEPLALVAWFVRRLILSIDQKIVWILLIILSVWLGLRLLPAQSEQLRRRFHKFDQKPPLDRFGAWRALFQTANFDADSRDELAAGLRKLLVDTLCAAERKTPAEVEAALTSGQMRLPDEVADDLFPEKFTRRRPIPTVTGWILAHLPRPLAKRLAPRLSQPSKTAGAVLHYLETYLENPDESL